MIPTIRRRINTNTNHHQRFTPSTKIPNLMALREFSSSATDSTLPVLLPRGGCEEGCDSDDDAEEDEDDNAGTDALRGGDGGENDAEAVASAAVVGSSEDAEDEDEVEAASFPGLLLRQFRSENTTFSA